MVDIVAESKKEEKGEKVIFRKQFPINIRYLSKKIFFVQSTPAPPAPPPVVNVVYPLFAAFGFKFLGAIMLKIVQVGEGTQFSSPFPIKLFFFGRTF